MSRSMKRPRDTSPGPGTSANYSHTARSQRPVDQGRHSKLVESKVCNLPKCACMDPNPQAPSQVWYNQQQEPFRLWQPGCEQMVAPWPWQPCAWHFGPPSLIAPPPTPTFWQYPSYSWSPPANSSNCNCYYCHHARAMSSVCYRPARSTEASPHMDNAPPPGQQQHSVTNHSLKQPIKTEGEGDLVTQEVVEKSFFTILPCE